MAKQSAHKKYIHGKGQYFTTNEYLKECVFSLIKNDPNLILEPSMGQGRFGRLCEVEETGDRF